MDTRRIGSLDVSTVGLGCNNFGWHLDEPASREVVHAALDAGITHFDCADVYGEGESERILGRALGDRRDDVVVVTKFGIKTGGSPENVRRSIEASLGRLGMDHVDLYYLHRPDADTPIADTLGAMSRLVEEGTVREIGCSGFSPEQMREAAAVQSEARFVAVQNEYSLLHRDPEGDGGVLDTAREVGMAFVPFFPLKSGLLTGKYRRGDAAPEGSRLSGVEGSFFKGQGDELLTEDNLDTVERLIAVAEACGHTVLDLAFAYLLAHDPVASVIAGATKPSQIPSNVEAAGWTLSQDDLDAVDEALAQAA